MTAPWNSWGKDVGADSTPPSLLRGANALTWASVLPTVCEGRVGAERTSDRSGGPKQEDARDHQRRSEQTAGRSRVQRHSQKPEVVEDEPSRHLAGDEEADHGSRTDARQQHDRGADVEDAAIPPPAREAC